MNREARLEAIDALNFALNPIADLGEARDDHQGTVIAFDTNVLLRLKSHPKSDDIIDFLRTSFLGKLLLPGQVIQEFWNHLNVVETLAKSIERHFGALKKETEKIDSGHDDFAARFQNLIDEFQTSYGYIYDDGTLRTVKLVISLLSEKATVPYSHRNELSSTAMIRKATKTPPGFRDESDGDFFVWADLLLGLAHLKESGFTPSRVAFVTHDSKPDWSRNGVPHPILSAEIRALCGATFQIWTLKELAKLVPA